MPGDQRPGRRGTRSRRLLGYRARPDKARDEERSRGAENDEASVHPQFRAETRGSGFHRAANHGNVHPTTAYD